MTTSIEETLRELDSWYQDSTGNSERPKFISKLAMLEFCGWLEFRIDEIVREAARLCGADSDWVEEKLIRKTHGFKYHEHFRPMLCSLLGVGCVGRIEARLARQNNADLDQLRSNLKNYWDTRSSLAHTHSGEVQKQLQLNAPSWCINQQRVTSKILTRYEQAVFLTAQSLIMIPPLQ